MEYSHRAKTTYPQNLTSTESSNTRSNGDPVPIRAGSSSWDATPPFNHPEWIICEVIQIICFLGALYILYALIHFYTVQESRHIYSGRTSGGRCLEKMCIMAVVCAIVRFTSNQILLLTGWYTRERCSILLNISIALYFVSLYPVYFFLWIRQRIFYSNRALKYLYNRVIRFVSWGTIFCFIVLTAVSMIMFVVDGQSSASERVCAYHDAQGGLVVNDVRNTSDYGMVDTVDMRVNVPQETKKQGLRVNTLAGLIGGAIQISFLVLFLYPIMDHRLRAVRNVRLKCHHSLMKLIRRAFVLSGVCIFTDVGLAFGVKGVHALFPEANFALIVMYDLNLIINIICIVATFRRWRHMLFPWLYDRCGRSILPQSTKTYYIHRRSSVGLNWSNLGSFKISVKEPKDKNREDVWELKVLKSPVIDVLLGSDDAYSEEKEKDKNAERVKEEISDEHVSSLINPGNNSKLYFPIENTTGGAVSNGTRSPIGEKLDKNQNEKNELELTDFSRFKFSRNSLKKFHPRLGQGNTADHYEGPSHSMRKSKTTPNFMNSQFSSRRKKTDDTTVIKSEVILETPIDCHTSIHN